FFSFTSTAPPHIYTLSLHDALPISLYSLSLGKKNSRIFHFSLFFDFSNLPISSSFPTSSSFSHQTLIDSQLFLILLLISLKPSLDRKSTRLNSSHVSISYAVFCLKK